MASEKGGSEKNGQSYYDGDTKLSEEERPHGGASFNGEGMTNVCECRFSDIIFQGGKPFSRMGLFFGRERNSSQVPLIMLNHSVQLYSEVGFQDVSRKV